MEEKKDAAGSFHCIFILDKKDIKMKETRAIKVHCPTHVGDPKLDQLISCFSSKVSRMTYTEMSNLLMFKNIKNLHEEAFAEAQRMGNLKHGNYFPITGLLFTINYRTEVSYLRIFV